MNTLARGPRPRRSGGLAALLVLPLLVAGCNYFRPARPELPQGDPLVADYSTPDKTFETIVLAIQDKSTSNGQSAYIGAFAAPGVDGDGFTATFDPLTVARFPGQPTEWDLSREEIFYTNLARLLPTSEFLFAWGDFRGAPEDRPNENPAVFYRSYTLRATPDGGGTYVPVARGNVELHMVQFGTNWKILKWIDSEDPLANIDIGEVCFGQLRLSGP